MSEEVIIACDNSKEKRIFVNSSNELVFALQDEKNHVLCDNVSDDFDVIAEKNGVISVMVVTINGTLLFFRFVFGNWEKQTVLDSKSEDKKINNIRLIKMNGRIHAFYCIEYDDKRLLIHHISQNNNFYTKPTVVDYIGSRCIYHISCDDDYNIHIVYADEESKIKYKLFLNSSKSYSDTIVSCDDTIRSISTVFFKNKLYCVYLSKEREYNVINCFNLSDNEKHTVGFGVDALSDPCIFSCNNVLYIEWREKGYAFECSTEDDFKFTKPFLLGYSENMIKLRSHTNETASFIDKCAANVYKTPFSSAKSIFKSLCEKDNNHFKIKGSEVEEFKKKNIYNEHYYDERFLAIENQLTELTKKIELLIKNVNHDIGEIDEENLKKFNELKIEDAALGRHEEENCIEIRRNDYESDKN